MARKMQGTRLNGLREVLAFCAGKSVVREMTFLELEDARIGYAESEAGVVFDDGSMLAVFAANEGFGGSEVTAPDPVEVIYIARPTEGI